MATIDPAPAAMSIARRSVETTPSIVSSAAATAPQNTSATTQPPSTTATNPTPPASQISADPPTTTSAQTADANTPPFSPDSTTPVLEKEELDFSGNVDVNNDLPTEQDLKRVGDLVVLDSQGVSTPFKEVFGGQGKARRQLVIFVRHFFCGNCQEYLRTLSSSITPESLLALPTPTFITVIGCGRPELIDMYISTTSCPFPVYADPSHKLYDYLGMTRTLNLGKKPNYIHSNLFVTSVQSIVQSLKTGDKALKGGDFKQVGGEFLFEDGKVTWVHRMRNTRDHAEIEDLRRVIGLDDQKPPIRKRWSHKVEEKKEGRMRSKSWGRVRSKSKSKAGDGKEGSLTGSTTPEEVREEEEDAKALEVDMKLSGKSTV